MDREALVKRWIEKLRHPEAKQCTGRLGLLDGSRCCLGVACDVFIEMGGKMDIGEEYHQGGKSVRYNEETAVMPRVVMNAFGISLSSGQYDVPSGSSCLSHDNDNGKTFAQIADIIESKPEGLFRD